MPGLAALAIALVAGGCGASVFQCSDTADCAGPSGGVCEASGFCSFPDGACDSGRRYGKYASAALASACVEPDVDGPMHATGSGSGATSGSGPMGSTSIEPRPGSTSTVGGEETASTASSNITVNATTLADTGSTGPLDTSTTAAGVVETIEVSASIAACTDPLSNDPLACETSTATTGFSVDLVNDALMQEPTTAFLAFETGAVPPGAQLLSAVLVLSTTDQSSAESMNQTGEVWRTEPFTLESLSGGQPELSGLGAIAADQGGVAVSQLVEWDLPLSDDDLLSTLHLAIVPTSALGVDYWNAAGGVPPALLLEVLVPG